MTNKEASIFNLSAAVRPPELSFNLTIMFVIFIFLILNEQRMKALTVGSDRPRIRH